MSDIAYLDGISVPGGNGHIVEICRILDLAGSADREVLRSGFHASAGHLHILALQRRKNICNREAIGAQPFRIHDDVDFSIGASLNLDLANAGAVFKFLFDQLVGNQCHIAGRTRRGNGDLKNGAGVRIHFRNHRNFGARRQIVDDLIDFVLNFLGGYVAIFRQIELNSDKRHPFR